MFLPNWLPLVFSLPVLVWICGYSLAKRFTAAAHLWLGAALALSPISAWIAIRGEQVQNDLFDLCLPMAVAIAIAFWVAGFDIVYACQDAEFDRQHGLKSIPAVWGISDALRLAAILHAMMLCVLGSLPLLFPNLSLGWIYVLGWFLVAGLVIRQHWLVSASDLTRLNIAFFNINSIISLGFTSLADLDAITQF